MMQTNSNFAVPPQQKNINGAYSFDLKLNIDFNTGHVQLKTPPSVPFIRKQQIPVSNAIIHTQPVYSLPNVPINPPLYQIRAQSPFSRNCKVSQSTFGPQLSTSMNSTFHMQQTLEAVECVICQKIIKSQDFSNHLLEHRNRKKEYVKINHPQYSFHNSQQISIRDKNELAEATELLKEIPAQTQTNKQNHENSRFSSQITFQPCQPPSMPHNSRQLPSYAVNSPHSEFYLSHSSANDQSSLQTLNPINSTFSQSSAHPNTHALHFAANIAPNFNPILHNNFNPTFSSPNDRNNNPFQFHKIESVIIRPDQNRGRQVFQDCGQSEISCNSLPSRQSSVYQIQKELDRRYQNVVSDINSDDEDEQDFHRPYKSYHSVGWTAQNNRTNNLERSQMTQKLWKSKLPVNYLAREQFIESTTQNSGNRKSTQEK